MLHFVVFGEPFDFADKAHSRHPDARVTVVMEKSRRAKASGLDAADTVIDINAGDPVILNGTAAAELPPTHVVALVDHLMLDAANFAADRGIAFHNVDVVNRMVDKATMRTCLAGIPELTASFAVALTYAELETAVGDLGLPVIVKPSESTGSQGVTRVDHFEQLASAWERARSISPRVIAEEFLSGDQYSVEAFTAEGSHFIVAVTRKYSDPETFVELGHMLPAPLDAATRDKFIQRTRMLLEAVELTYGPSHTEFVLTSRGPIPIESHARVGGDQIYLMVKDATGVDLDAAQVDQLFGDSLTGRLVSQNQLAQATWFGASSMPGKLPEVLPPSPEGMADVTLTWLTEGEYESLESSNSRVFQVRVANANAVDALEQARLIARGCARAAGLKGEYYDTGALV